MLCGLQVTCTYVCKIINRQCISFSHPLPLSVALRASRNYKEESEKLGVHSVVCSVSPPRFKLIL